MRFLTAITALLLLAMTAQRAEAYGSHWGPYQPYAHSPYLYFYNPGAPPYPFPSYQPTYYRSNYHWDAYEYQDRLERDWERRVQRYRR